MQSEQERDCAGEGKTVAKLVLKASQGTAINFLLQLSEYDSLSGKFPVSSMCSIFNAKKPLEFF